jgi:HAD superfamily phosphatase
VASSEANIENLRRGSLPYAVNSLAVIADSAALEEKKYIEGVIKEVNTEVMKALKEIRPKERHAGDITPEAVLFDMDGVLVDVSASYRLAIKKTAEYFLKESVSVQEIQRYKEQGGYNNDWDLTEMILLSHGINVSRKNMVKVFQHFYRGKNFNGFIRNERWLLDRKVLHTLSKDFKLGIVTGRPKREAEYALKKFEVKDCFEIVIAMEDVRGKSKPDPHGIHLALKILNAKRALYVGDTIDDILSAASAGVTPVGIIPSQAANRRRIEGVFRKSGAKHILENVNKILEVLE